MPKCSWEQLNDLIHEQKGDLTTISGIEVTCKKLREKMNTKLEKMYDIVLQQIDDGGRRYAKSRRKRKSPKKELK